MSETILLLRLEGPLQSWGVRSRWSRRDTGPEPSKSAIIGLLGCAAGIPRPEWRPGVETDRTLEQWDEALLFGVRIDRRGTIETDYHTVQGHHWQADGKMKTALSISGASYLKAHREPPHTEITWRGYLHDAAFLVALSVKSEYRASKGDLLAELKEYLQYPKWPLYLGRKSCVPSRPIFEGVTDAYENLEAAFRKVAWAAPRLGTGSLPTLEAWIESPDGEDERQDAMRLNQLRFYDFRRCKRIEVDARYLPRGSG